MDAMVSARVPAEIKKRGDKKLRELGSSVTELVNSAYAYLLEYGKLPKEEHDPASSAPITKTLAGSDARSFRDAWESRSVIPAAGYDGSNFREMLDQARDDRYARLA